MGIQDKNNFGYEYVGWMGVVESRSDPLNLGRAQVRIINWHSEDKTLIPSKDLPWAMPLLPLNNDSPTPPKEGSWVAGFFLDGRYGQHPIMMGVIPGIPEKTPNKDKGFSDQRTDEELQNAPKPPQKREWKTDGTGIVITEKDAAERYPNILNEPTTSRIARNEHIDETIIQEKKDNIVESIPVASVMGPNFINDIIDQIIDKVGDEIPTSDIFETVEKVLNIPNVGIEGLSSILSNLPNLSGGLMAAVSAIEPGLFEQINYLPNEVMRQIEKIPADVLGPVSSKIFSLSNSAIYELSKIETSIASSIPQQLALIPGNLFNEINGLEGGISEITGLLTNLPNKFLSNVLDHGISGDLLGSIADLGDDVIGNLSQISGGNWSEPETAYDAVYPYNKVLETESGHVVEYDDTPGKERISVTHRSGSTTEYHPDGTIVQKSTKDSVVISMADRNINVMGDYNITVNGNAKIYSKGDLNIQVDGNLNANVAGDWNSQVTGDFNLSAKNVKQVMNDYSTVANGKIKQVSKSLSNQVDGDIEIKNSGDYTATIKGQTTINSTGDIVLDTDGNLDATGTEINLNEG